MVHNHDLDKVEWGGGQEGSNSYKMTRKYMMNVKENASVTLNGMFPAIQRVNAELAMKLASPHMESILVSKEIFKIKHGSWLI